MNARSALAAIPSIPRDDEGPVFAEPWHAQAFAMALSLNQQGIFSWSEWAQAIGAEIARDGSPETYYANWLTALEKLVAQKGLVDDDERNARKDAWERASRATPHGEAIVLGREKQ